MYFTKTIIITVIIIITIIIIIIIIIRLTLVLGEIVRSAPDKESTCDESELRIDMGTSMSVPFVSGAAALLREFFMTGKYAHKANAHFLNTLPIADSNQTASKNATALGFRPSSALLKAMLIHSAVFVNVSPDEDDEISSAPDWRERSLHTAFPSFHQGFGRVQLGNLLSSDHVDSLLVHQSSLMQGNYQIICFEPQLRGNLNPNSPALALLATMVYTDPPVSPASTSILVNDLDLQLYRCAIGEIETSTIVWGNHQNDNQPDSLNNVERAGIYFSNQDNNTTNGHSEQYCVKVRLVQIIQLIYP